MPFVYYAMEEPFIVFQVIAVHEKGRLCAILIKDSKKFFSVHIWPIIEGKGHLARDVAVVDISAVGKMHSSVCDVDVREQGLGIMNEGCSEDGEGSCYAGQMRKYHDDTI
jgi:hypothetical protein